jgi:hypothetical protein
LKEGNIPSGYQSRYLSTPLSTLRISNSQRVLRYIHGSQKNSKVKDPAKWSSVSSFDSQILKNPELAVLEKFKEPHNTGTPPCPKINSHP